MSLDITEGPWHCPLDFNISRNGSHCLWCYGWKESCCCKISIDNTSAMPKQFMIFMQSLLLLGPKTDPEATVPFISWPCYFPELLSSEDGVLFSLSQSLLRISMLWSECLQEPRQAHHPQSLHLLLCTASLSNCPGPSLGLSSH